MTHRAYFLFIIYLDPQHGAIALAKQLTAIRGDKIRTIVKYLNANGYRHETEDESEARRIFELTKGMSQHSGFVVDEMDEQGKPTNECSWINVYSYFARKEIT